jgi:hypothetical protein
LRTEYIIPLNRLLEYVTDKVSKITVHVFFDTLLGGMRTHLFATPFSITLDALGTAQGEKAVSAHCQPPTLGQSYECNPTSNRYMAAAYRLVDFLYFWPVARIDSMSHYMGEAGVITQLDSFTPTCTS